VARFQDRRAAGANACSRLPARRLRCFDDLAGNINTANGLSYGSSWFSVRLSA
jgi:hypothetical protein